MIMFFWNSYESYNWDSETVFVYNFHFFIFLCPNNYHNKEYIEIFIYFFALFLFD